MFKLLVKLSIVGVVALLIAALWFWNTLTSFEQTPINIQGTKSYTIESGSSLHKVARHLQSEGIIDNARLFVWMTRIEGLDSRIQAGEYELNGELTPVSLLALFVSGKVKQYSITLLEGWSYKEVFKLIQQNEKLKHVITDYSAENVMKLIGKEGIHPEGQFFPDTYNFPSGTTDIQFLKRANQMMEKVLNDEWQKREENLPLKSPYEALILASIVEKETGNPSDRDRIAGVFIRRLKKRMLLQTDPTVIYGMGDAFDGNIRRKDLRKDTPYNTYTRKGLTPSPIALPGREAIHAALHPDNSNALYFVSKGNGDSHFSATLQEHNEAVIKYQLKGRRKSFSSYKAK